MTWKKRERKENSNFLSRSHSFSDDRSLRGFLTTSAQPAPIHATNYFSWTPNELHNIYRKAARAIKSITNEHKNPIVKREQRIRRQKLSHTHSCVKCSLRHPLADKGRPIWFMKSNKACQLFVLDKYIKSELTNLMMAKTMWMFLAPLSTKTMSFPEPHSAISGAAQSLDCMLCKPEYISVTVAFKKFTFSKEGMEVEF